MIKINIMSARAWTPTVSKLAPRLDAYKQKGTGGTWYVTLTIMGFLGEALVAGAQNCTADPCLIDIEVVQWSPTACHWAWQLWLLVPWVPIGHPVVVRMKHLHTIYCHQWSRELLKSRKYVFQTGLLSWLL